MGRIAKPFAVAGMVAAFLLASLGQSTAQIGTPALDNQSALAAAVAAKAAYGDVIDDRFEVVDRRVGRDGFAAATIRDRQTGNVHVGVAGTNLKDFNDILADTSIALGGEATGPLRSQIEQAIAYVGDVISFEGVPTTVGGDSLGGYSGALAGAHFGLDTIVTSAPAPTSEDVVDFVGDAIVGQHFRLVRESDPIGNWRDPVFGVELVYPDETALDQAGFLDQHTGRAGARTYVPPTKNHSLDAFIDGLKNEKIVDAHGNNVPFVGQIQVPDDGRVGALFGDYESPLLTANERQAQHKQQQAELFELLNLDFIPITDAMARTILEVYGAVPGGVVLESAVGAPTAFGVPHYSMSLNRFFFEDGRYFVPTISADEVREIFLAIHDRDEIGVAISQTTNTLFGAIHLGNRVARMVMVADIILGGVALDLTREPQLAHYRLADGYVQAKRETERVAFFFRFRNEGFGLAGDEFISTGVAVEITLIPWIGNFRLNRAEPDFDRIADYVPQPSDAANVGHLVEYFSYYARERAVRAVVGYVVVADLARQLKAAGVDMSTLVGAERDPLARVRVWLGR